MAVKKKSVKKNSKVSPMMKKEMSCDCNTYMGKGYSCVKIASMAFILFLVTVWKNPVGNWLVNVHWGWYLGIFIVFSVIAMARMCKNWKCKK